MSFRSYQKIPVGGCTYCPESDVKTLEDGKIIRTKVRKNFELPPADDLDLHKLIKAGVRIDSVNPKVIHSGVLGSEMVEALDDASNDAFIELEKTQTKE